jgi:hypothetical protein
MLPNPEYISSIYSEYQLFSFYLNRDIIINKLYNSPFRKDNNPSFKIYELNNKLYFKDFGGDGDSGNIYSLVMKLFGLSTYTQALNKIWGDVILNKTNSQNSLFCNYKNKSYIKKKSTTDIQVKVRQYTLQDLEYWKSYGICYNTLKKYKVYPISYIFINNIAYPAEEYAYIYIEKKESIITFKIYQPYSKKFKWLNKHDYSIHQGYTLLPVVGNILIITSSLKDVMSIHDILSIPAIAPQAETVSMKKSVIREYKNRFKNILVLMDNDEAGIINAIKYKKNYDLDLIFTPSTNFKDFSDMVKIEGVRETKNYFNSLIKSYL